MFPFDDFRIVARTEDTIMGHRLSKIYTRTGDDGTTGLGDGSRIEKDHPRMQTIGSVDELNSLVGMLIAELADDTEAAEETDELQPLLTAIQHDLFNLGGELSIPGYVMVKEERIAELETALDQLNDQLPPLKNFILPGGSRAAAACHLARAVCRRAERDMVALSRTSQINGGEINGVGINMAGRHYLNRLSDLLFVMARVIARRNGGQEVLWQQPKG
ncbi:MAG: cob(I)yrinic acid a,c-diamide adenosyltransferase [Spongiibacteraceae bacterium]